MAIDLNLGGTGETVRELVKGGEKVFQGMRDTWSFGKTHQCICAYYSLFKRRTEMRPWELAAVRL